MTVSVIFVWETKEANVAIVRVVVAGNCSAHVYAPAATPWTKPSDHLGRVWNARGKYSRDCLWHKRSVGRVNVMAVLKMLTAAFS